MFLDEWDALIRKKLLSLTVVAQKIKTAIRNGQLGRLGNSTGQAGDRPMRVGLRIILPELVLERNLAADVVKAIVQRGEFARTPHLCANRFNGDSAPFGAIRAK